MKSREEIEERLLNAWNKGETPNATASIERNVIADLLLDLRDQNAEIIPLLKDRAQKKKYCIACKNRGYNIFIKGQLETHVPCSVCNPQAVEDMKDIH